MGKRIQKPVFSIHHEDWSRVACVTFHLASDIIPWSFSFTICVNLIFSENVIISWIRFCSFFFSFTVSRPCFHVRLLALYHLINIDCYHLDITEPTEINWSHCGLRQCFWYSVVIYPRFLLRQNNGGGSSEPRLCHSGLVGGESWEVVMGGGQEVEVAGEHSLEGCNEGGCSVELSPGPWGALRI